VSQETPKSVRPGEELPLEIIQAYLENQGFKIEGELKHAQFPSGYSNLTYLISDQEQQFVLRRPPNGARAKGGHDMEREYRILSGLYPVYSKIPKPIHLCTDSEVLGAPFYIMEKVDGIIIRNTLPNELATPEILKRLSLNIVDALVEIHQVDVKSAGFENFGRPKGYVSRQIHGWSKRYKSAMTDDIVEIGRVSEWLQSNIPQESGVSLIHNDYKIDNVILSPSDLSVRAVLDWEMATVGCPHMDLGAALGYWIDADDSPLMRMLPVGPTHEKGHLNRLQAVSRYEEKTGEKVMDPVFYYVYGVWRIAVILQQIYQRYKLGYTTDPRFKTLIHAVRLLSIQGERAIQRDRYWALG
jgi:aminoglycoside phosphotransferase (APT) family kinase protein